MRIIGIKTLSLFVSTVMLASMMMTSSYHYYGSWTLRYNVSGYSDHTSHTYYLAVHDHYRIEVTSTAGSQTPGVKLTLNGVVQYLTGTGSLTTYDYTGTTMPTLTMILRYKSGAGPLYMAGNIQVEDD